LRAALSGVEAGGRLTGIAAAAASGAALGDGVGVTGRDGIAFTSNMGMLI
jgi:hypothetical protein